MPNDLPAQSQGSASSQTNVGQPEGTPKADTSPSSNVNSSAGTQAIVQQILGRMTQAAKALLDQAEKAQADMEQLNQSQLAAVYGNRTTQDDKYATKDVVPSETQPTEEQKTPAGSPTMPSAQPGSS